MRQLIFRKSYYVGIEKLPADQRLEVYDAIMKYAFTGEVVDVTKSCTPLLSMIVESISRDFDRYEQRYRESN
jgi:hypothetical protein